MHGSFRLTERPVINREIISSTVYKILKHFGVFLKDEIYQILFRVAISPLTGLLGLLLSAFNFVIRRDITTELIIVKLGMRFFAPLRYATNDSYLSF